ncbi:hypothetical protein MMC16_001824 [Acarospora aff. strigata]|nr:hypothetical protein [Acarospora aff. strigata]
MASVFTYDPDPPRVSSPWLVSGTKSDGSADPPLVKRHASSTANARCILLADCGITKLEAEPPEGPTEYKLHLLLRPRRCFSASSTGQYVSGSHHSKLRPSSGAGSLDEANPRVSSPVPTPSSQSRQNRLEHLTTQLLWRLQQSSPYHSSSTNDLILPILPEATPTLGAPLRPAKLLPGLEESRGALYEIGVSDDGSFVGLTQDEMEESLTNLKAMAASLGCNVELLRTVIVGDCEWIDDFQANHEPQNRIHREKLWVAEALIVPNMDSSTTNSTVYGTPAPCFADMNSAATMPQSSNGAPPMASIESQATQLRVSLTGATTSGKSSLLGTLSTATLDNGRGKSRLSLLKHRHEIASGVTSSVSQELIGYRDVLSETEDGPMTEVINYASGNVSSWNDIHASSETGRLVFVSDSAGHPRYRRTAVRGLVSWAPHWTLCCIAGAYDVHADGKSGVLASAVCNSEMAPFLDPTNAHLDLCLKLELPLVVVITKLDLASKAGLRQTLARVLSALKSAGRRPVMLSSILHARTQEDLRFVSREEEAEVDKLLGGVSYDKFRNSVPILLTSVVNGSGISKVHALLRKLPLPASHITHSEAVLRCPPRYSRLLFHIDEIFAMPSSQMTPVTDEMETTFREGTILSGYLRYGELAVGDAIHLGPLTTERHYDEASSRITEQAISLPPPLRDAAEPFQSEQLRHYPSDFNDLLNHIESRLQAGTEWQTVRVVSIRNLRLPVRKLLEGQVGTIGVKPITPHRTSSSLPATTHLSLNKILRKGMVLTNLGGRDDMAPPLPACSGFLARFEESNLPLLSLGSLVIVYIASVRASARVTRLNAVRHNPLPDSPVAKTDSGIFDFDDDGSDDGSPYSIHHTDDSLRPSSVPDKVDVEFQFVAYREWIEVGGLVLVIPAGGHGRSGSGDKSVGGLDGFVGRISAVLQ